MNEAFLKQAKAKAAKYCSLRERAPLQVFEKLLSWNLTESQAQSILLQLTSENFLNEKRFCKAFCHDKFELNQWGKRRIRLELTRYNLPAELIDEGLSSIEPERYEEVLGRLAANKWRQASSESDLWKRKNKTVAFLIRKGFETDLVWEVVNQLPTQS